MIPPSTRIRAFVIVFSVMCALVILLVVVAEFSELKWVKKIEEMGQSAGRMIFTAAAITFVSVEGVPMLAHWLRRAEVQKAREEGREAGREEGEDRMYREWQSWSRAMEAWQLRKETAERENREFTEPAPPEPRSPTSRE